MEHGRAVGFVLLGESGRAGWGLQAPFAVVFSSTEGGIVIYYLTFLANRWKALCL